MDTSSSSADTAWKHVSPVLAITALVLSLAALFMAYRADVVELGPPTGSAELNAYRAQVEELQRANDRILNTAWAAIGIVASLAVVLVTFNFIRGDRVIEGERKVIEERFQATVDRRHDELRTQVSEERQDRERYESESREWIEALTKSNEQLRDDLRSERQDRAELQFQLVQFQREVLRLAQDITSAGGPLLPFYYTRVYGPLPTAVGLLRSAIVSEKSSLVISALTELKSAALGPIPENDSVLLDEILPKVEALPPSYNPLREEVLAALRGRLQKILGMRQGENRGSGTQ